MQYTEDSIWRSDIRILQPAKGYRFAVDAVLLAHFIRTKPGERMLEIGAGSGVVSILLSAWNNISSVVAVEVQSELAELCRKNFERNRIPNGIVLEADVKKAIHNPGRSETLPYLNRESFDLIYSNPPYRKTGSGKLNPMQQKAIARHELKLSLHDLFDCATALLNPTGRLSLILPVFRETDFYFELSRSGMHLREWKYVHSFATEPPAFFLATAGKRSAPTVHHPPLVIYAKPGEYTAVTQRLLESSD